MTFDFRYPQITGATEREQLAQMRSYMIQLVDQLRWALNNTESAQGNYVIVREKGNSGNSGAAAMSLDVMDDDSVQAHFNEIKPLIIKSAEIVEAYYAEISRRLEGLYVAQSDFGTFVEQTSQDIEANSTEITQNFTNLQQIINSNIDLMLDEIGSFDTKLEDAKGAIVSDIDKLKDDLEKAKYDLIEVNAHIISGLIDYDGEIPVYGLEVGQKNIVNGVEVFNKYARFTAGRLSFYDNNGTEVAYISDYKLYITHAEVTGTLKLGGYLVDTSRGLTFKWVGRS